MTVKDDDLVVLCHPVVELPNPQEGAKVAKCLACGCDVWISVKTQKFHCKNYLCFNCGPEHMTDDSEFLGYVPGPN